MLDLTSEQLKRLALSTNVLSSWEKGQGQKDAKDLESRLLLSNARARLSQGVQQAQEHRRVGEKTSSDAIAAMAAGGGVVDEKILAKIKAKADYNAMASMYNARVESAGLESEARLRNMEGRRARRSEMFGAVSNLFTNWNK